MSTPVIGSGIFIRDNEYKLGANVDKYHLWHMMKNSNPTDLGPIEFWAQTQAVQMPLYRLTDFGRSGVIDVTDPMGRYTWQSPIATEMPYITRDVDSSDTTKGKDGRRFRIALDKGPQTGGFSHTDVLSFDKFSTLQFRVTEDRIIDAGNNEFIYTCEIVRNSNTSYVSNTFLTNGTKVFKITSGRSDEYGQAWSQVNSINGFREFYNIMGNAMANSSYTVSRVADCMIRKNGQRTNGTVPVKEVFKINDDTIKNDPSIRNIDQLESALGKVEFLKRIQKGDIDASFLTLRDAEALTSIGNQIEGNMMWGTGGIVGNDGPDQIRFNTGLWQQANNGYKKVYNIGTFTIDMFRSEIYNYYRGKVNFDGPDPGRKLVVQTGMAGLQQAMQAIERMAVNSSMVINASEVGAIKQGLKGALDLDFGYAYTSYTIPFLANVKFIINPAFDNVETNQIENPTVNGYPLSSYSYIIFDITDRSDTNIRLLQSAYDHELVWMHINGLCDYMGKKMFQSSGGDFGYKVQMMQKHKALTVLDPSRLLKMVALNPITGGSL